MMNVSVELPGVVLGILEADVVQVRPTATELSTLLDKLASDTQRAYSVESLAEAEPSRAVRAMFRAWGVDPSKYRPSSEALQRRVVQGKGLYRVSNVVDIGNLGSIETGWPYGLYDRAQISADVALRHGIDGEVYEGIGKRMWHLAGRPVIADVSGPFGSPISDSTRTMIQESTHEIFAVIYAPNSVSPISLRMALAKLGERLTQFASAHISRSDLCQQIPTR
jgi:DNA/RNA-binding domain of Phe-tRNA-synthetase-like protein